MLRAVDYEDTYVYWRWLDEDENVFADKIPVDVLRPLLDVLQRALPVAGPGETPAQATARALRDGPFADLVEEAALSTALGRAVLPEVLREQIISRRSKSAKPVHLRVTPSQRLAQIPWEILTVDGRARLLEYANVTYEPPATVRSQLADDRVDSAAEHRALYVLDPQLPDRAVDAGMLQTMDTEAVARFTAHISARDVRQPATASVPMFPAQATVGRIALGEALRHAKPSRLFYFGHVSSTAFDPGSASLHLSDSAAVWGRAEQVGAGQPSIDDHLPFSALDILQGTMPCGDVWTRRTFGVGDDPRPGMVIWPMPPRVALIACEGGADYRAAETFGLVMAMITNGARLVTTSRWIMPTDNAFRRYMLGPQAKHASPTTELALRVDDAHTTADPIEDLAEWQRTKLADWLDTGSMLHSPVVWAALSNTAVPAAYRPTAIGAALNADPPTYG